MIRKSSGQLKKRVPRNRDQQTRGTMRKEPETVDGLPVKSIGRNAFRDTGVAEVSLPEGLDSIGYRAFAFCGHLRKIRLPDSLQYIGREAFRGCERLEEIRIPDSVKEIGV